MGEGNFFKKALQVLTVTGLSALPIDTKDIPPTKEKLTPISVNKNTQTEGHLNKEDVALLNEESAIGKGQEYFISKEYLKDLVDTLRQRVIADIRDNSIIDGGLSNHTGFDHVLLAIGDASITDSLKYNEFMIKLADSLNLGVSKYFPDSHRGSVGYSLLRSGVYDEWKNKGGDWATQADAYITRSTNLESYIRHDYEWLMLTFLELAKRGKDTTFYNYAIDPSEMNKVDTREEFDSLQNIKKPFNLDEMYKLNENELECVLDPVKKKEYENEKETKDGNNSLYESPGTCGGTHALHALVVADLYLKKSENLQKHLGIATSMLQTALEKQVDSTSNAKAVGDALHSISHSLLPFTELPEYFVLDSETKKNVQLAIRRMCDLSEFYSKHFISKEDYSMMELSHVIEVLDHLSEPMLKN